MIKTRTYLGQSHSDMDFLNDNSFAWKGFDLEIFLQRGGGKQDITTQTGPLWKPCP